MTVHFTERKYGEGGHRKSKYGKGGHELGPEGAEVVRPVPSRWMCRTDTPLDPILALLEWEHLWVVLLKNQLENCSER